MEIRPEGDGFNTYVGSFVDGTKHGHAKLFLVDGATYEGLFKKGAFDG